MNTANDEFAPVEHVLQCRQGKCKSLAAASLGDSDDVPTAPDDRPALRLDRGGFVKVFDHAHDLCVRAEVLKVLDRFVRLTEPACNKRKVVKLVNILIVIACKGELIVGNFGQKFSFLKHLLEKY